MSDLTEVKELFETSQKSLHDLRAEFEEHRKKTADVVSEEKLAKMEADFAEKLKAQQEAASELKAIEDRLSKIETAGNRPGAPGGKPADAEMKSFTDWARGRPSDFESKAMTEGSNPDGGYLVPVAMRDGIQERLRRTSPVRSVANIVTIDGASYEMLVERGDTGYEWVGETQSRSETTSPTINKIAISAHELSAMPKVSQRMLDDAAFDLGAWLQGYIADRFARAEAGGYVTGSGVDKPRGFTTYDTAATADDSRSSGVLEHVVSGVSGGFDATNPADAFIDLVYKLHPSYRPGAVWMMKSTVAATVAKFKDGDGNYLLQTLMSGDGGPVTPTPAEGNVVDLLGYDAVTFAFITGTVTDAGDANGFTIKLQESDTTADADFTDVASADHTGTLSVTDDTDDTVAVGQIGYTGTKRYLRAVATGTAGTDAVISGIAILGRPNYGPAAATADNIAAT